MYILVLKLLENRLFGIFTGTCLFTFCSLFMQCTFSSFHKSARWPFLCYGATKAIMKQLISPFNVGFLDESAQTVYSMSTYDCNVGNKRL